MLARLSQIEGIYVPSFYDVAYDESGRITAITRNDEFVDREMVLKFMSSAAFWLVFAPSIGVILAIKFNFYDFLGHVPWLTWGRLRPVHIMGVVFGGFSTAVIGLTYYIVPRLCGVPMYKEKWGYSIFWLWNVFLTIGFISLALAVTNRPSANTISTESRLSMVRPYRRVK